MGDIKNYNPAEGETLNNQEVTEMVERQHKNPLRSISEYIENMKRGTKPKIEPSKFFISGTYADSIGRKLPCFLVTRKGCEFIANKLTGGKGTKLTAMYVTRFNIMEEHEKAAIGGKTAKNGRIPEELAAVDKWATATLLSAKNRVTNFLQRLYDRAGIKPERQAMTLSDFCSEDGIHFPRTTFQDMKQTCDKNTVAEKLGVYSKAPDGKVSYARAIGAIISMLDVPEDGRERFPYCNNGHDGVDYQYTKNMVEKVRVWIEAHGRPSPITVSGKNYAVIYEKE